MRTLGICIIFGLIFGLLCGSLGGVIIHEYKLNKCESLSSSTNQEYYNYELQNDCYFVLEKTGWNIVVHIVMVSFVCMLFFGFIGMVIGDFLE